ncbi:hypothetical protein [Longimicrobium sp.]|nr:hypothetical protein [Longimicrobium sp.]HEX6037079.1 hypothetical protein [Longimicrobium sp.]
MKRISALLCVLLALALTSCGNDTGVCPDPPCSASGDSSTVDRTP